MCCCNEDYFLVTVLPFSFYILRTLVQFKDFETSQVNSDKTGACNSY